MARKIGPSRTVSERAVQDALVRAFLGSEMAYDAASFADAGVLSANKGLVVRLNNGQEFQVTIVESTRR
jgi:hypothetical protein